MAFGGYMIPNMTGEKTITYEGDQKIMELEEIDEIQKDRLASSGTFTKMSKQKVATSRGYGRAHTGTGKSKPPLNSKGQNLSPKQP
jgi:acetylglutamate kinase